MNIQLVDIVSGWIVIIYLDCQCERLARGMDRERDARTTTV
ncbi:hypothetical protein QUA56_04750 [Microcoleus sp. N3A4]